jgi:hypothetical protein
MAALFPCMLYVAKCLREVQFSFSFTSLTVVAASVTSFNPLKRRSHRKNRTERTLI